MHILKAAFSTWIIGLPIALLLLVPAIETITFLLRCLFWIMGAFQAVTTGSTLPDFWG